MPTSSTKGRYFRAVTGPDARLSDDPKDKVLQISKGAEGTVLSDQPLQKFGASVIEVEVPKSNNCSGLGPLRPD